MTQSVTEGTPTEPPSGQADRAALSRTLLARLSDQCAVLEAAIAAGHQQGLALREVNLGADGLEAFGATVLRMTEQRDALASALARLMDAASALAGGPLPNLRAATPLLEPNYLRAWESGLSRLTSLNATLAEQQATAEIHARRGLTVLDAWRNVLGAPTDAGPTYNRYGQSRGQTPEAPPRLAIKL